MIKPTVPRRTRKIEENEIVKEKEAFIIGQHNFAKELSPHEDAEDDKLTFTADQRKEILKMFTEEPTFTSKRKQELKRLIETPVFTETVIRFRLPDGGIIESRFSPKERVRDLRQELEKVRSC